MPLEPTDSTATLSGSNSTFALETALMGTAEGVTSAEVTPVAQAASVTPAELTPAVTSTTPLDAVKPPEDDFMLPTDKLESVETEPIAKEVKNPAGYRIQELNKEIKEKLTPRISELEQTVTQREARILELQGLAARSSELETKLKDMETEISVVRLERTEAFQKEIEQPRKACEDKIKEFASAYGLDTRELFAAVVEADPGKRKAAIRALTSGLDIDRDDDDVLRDAVKDAHAIFAKQDELYANADKALAELEARKQQEGEASAAVRAEERVRAADIVATRVSKALPFLKDIVDSVVGVVKESDPDVLDVHNKAYNHLAGVALPKLATQYASVVAERDALLDEIASYQKSGARVGDLRSSAPGEGVTKSLLEGLLEGIGG